MLLMVIRLVRLIYNQKIKILIPTAISLSILAISLIILPYVIQEGSFKDKGFGIRSNVFYSICSSKETPNYFSEVNPAMIIVSSITYFSMISFLASSTCVFVVFRFHIQAAFYAVLILDRVVLQVIYRKYRCYDGEDKYKDELYAQYELAALRDGRISVLVIPVLVLEIVYQMFRRRLACFK